MQSLQERLAHGGISKKIWIFEAPGRNNLIGEHIDYNSEHVFPAALDLKNIVISRSAKLGGTKQFVIEAVITNSVRSGLMSQNNTKAVSIMTSCINVQGTGSPKNKERCHPCCRCKKAIS